VLACSCKYKNEKQLMTQSNSYADSMKMFMNPEYMTNAMKQMPDFTHFTEGFKKSAEAITSATQMAAESAQSIVRRSAEIVQAQITESFNAMKDLTATSNPEQAAARQQEFLKTSFENAMAGGKEIGEMTSKSAMEMFDLVGKNASSAMNQPMKAGSGKK
jgi:phasin family protein